jgi:rRNA maturation endonuclease Nob1
MKRAKPKRAIKTKLAKCKDCKTTWSVFACAPKQKCPACGGPLGRPRERKKVDE